MTPDEARDHEKELTTPNAWPLDIGSHINAGGEAAAASECEPAVRSSAMLAARPHLPVCIATMPYCADVHNVCNVVDRVDHAIVADADTPNVIGSL